MLYSMTLVDQGAYSYEWRENINRTGSRTYQVPDTPQATAAIGTSECLLPTASNFGAIFRTSMRACNIAADYCRSGTGSRCHLGGLRPLRCYTRGPSVLISSVAFAQIEDGTNLPESGTAVANGRRLRRSNSKQRD